MNRKHIRIALNAEDAKGFSKRKSDSEAWLGTSMTDSAFAAALIRGRLDGEILEEKISATVSFLRDLSKDESVPVDKRIESAELVVAITNGLEVKRR